MQLKVYVETGFVGATHEDIIEIDDDAAAKMTDDDFDDMAREFMHNVIEWGWKKVD